MKTSVKLAALTAMTILGYAMPASATSIVYTDFSNLSGLQINNAARSVHTCDSGGGPGCDAVADSLGRNVLRLTNNYSQSASAFSLSAITLNNEASFSSAFRFRISDIPGGNGICDEDGCGADGIVFTVQTNSNTSGGLGGGIGYQGLTRSVGVEIDPWNNGGIDDNNGNAIGIDVNGNVDSAVQCNVRDPADGVLANECAGVTGRLNNGADWFAWVDYDGSTDMLEFRLSNTSTRPTLATLLYSIDLLPVLDPTNTGTVNAFVGFTSGTGSARNYHDIISWQFNDDYQPIDQIGVPGPAAAGLLGFGLLGLGVLRRRR